MSVIILRLLETTKSLQAVPRELISGSVRSPPARRRKHCVPGSPAPSIHPPTSACGWSSPEETVGTGEPLLTSDLNGLMCVLFSFSHTHTYI